MPFYRNGSTLFLIDNYAYTVFAIQKFLNVKTPTLLEVEKMLNTKMSFILRLV